MTKVVYDLFDGDHARQFVDGLHDLYAEVYAEPPYNEGPQHAAQFVRWLQDEFNRSGFSLARATVNGSMVGAAYGFTLRPGEWMEPRVGEPPRDLFHAEKFNVAEWMVREPYRRTGVGRRLLDLVLAGRAEPYAILASNPAAPARQIYRRWGWKPSGEISPSTMPRMDVLVLRLKGDQK